MTDQPAPDGDVGVPPPGSVAVPRELFEKLLALASRGQPTPELHERGPSSVVRGAAVRAVRAATGLGHREAVHAVLLVTWCHDAQAWAKRAIDRLEAQQR